MTERAWDAIRAAVLALESKERNNAGSGRAGYLNRDDLVPLMKLLALPTEDGPPRRPDTYLTVKGAYAWWVHPVGVTDPAKAEVWVAPLESDGQPDYDNAYKPEAIENWEGFPWEGRQPTASELRGLTENIIATLGFLSAGPPNKDPLTEAAEAMLALSYLLVQEMETRGDPSDQAFERTMRNGLGGIFGDVGASFNPSVVEAVAELLTAIAVRAPADVITEKATWVGTHYLEARKNDDNRY